MALLQVGKDRTTIAGIELALGWRTIAQSFRHDPPSSLELENAIAAVEDELARVHESIAKGLTPVTDDPGIRDVAAAAGVAPGAQMTVTVEAVEQAFQRLAIRAPGLPAGAQFAATLLILRELMHHLQFPALEWRNLPP